MLQANKVTQPSADAAARNGKKPVNVVFVHGAWHSPSCWDELRNILSERQIQTFATANPSAGVDATRLKDMHADADHLKMTLDALNGPDVVVGHSYGGLVITDGASRSKNVEHLVYLGAFLPARNQSPKDIVGDDGLNSPAWDVFPEEGYLIPKKDQAGAIFYNDSTLDHHIPQLRKQSLSSLAQTPREYAYETYILTANDIAIAPALQKQMAEAANVSEIVETDCGHSPFVSKPVALADLIESIVKRVANKGN